MQRKYFESLSLFIERYYIETFVFESLIFVLLFPSLRQLGLLIFSLASVTIISEGIKILVREKRPRTAMERRYFRNGPTINKRSFPSTHSAVSMVFVGLLMGNYLAIPFFIFALIIMYSRLYLRSHYLRDIIAGGALGFVVGYAAMTLI